MKDIYKLIEKYKKKALLSYKKDAKVKYIVVIEELKKAKQRIEDEWNKIDENVNK